ncbi:hypothetical protein [Actinocatenispora sera]|uniref:Uncharacterized protein n=1 Tax=Actinocatenispora sera TaxID=390989 RepID=A0A810KWP5_9ACTN|nr:hypothetical protein [Actinocatenispora sera]BCJ27095.1 hypothetical protein Asera_12030 [Actinocatenispora sera]
MTFQTEALLASLAIMITTALCCALILYLADRAIIRWERRKPVAATDPYAQAQALAARQLALRHRHGSAPLPALGPSR